MDGEVDGDIVWDVLEHLVCEWKGGWILVKGEQDGGGGVVVVVGLRRGVREFCDDLCDGPGFGG